MAIVVTALPPTEDFAAENVTYPDAIKWVVDGDERLHIIGRDGNLATYNRGFWANVRKVFDKPKAEFNVSDVQIDTKDIATRARLAAERGI